MRRKERALTRTLRVFWCKVLDLECTTTSHKAIRALPFLDTIVKMNTIGSSALNWASIKA